MFSIKHSVDKCRYIDFSNLCVIYVQCLILCKLIYPGYITFFTCCNCIPPTPSGDCVTLMKAAVTAKSSVSAVKLYPEEYSCNM